MSAPERSVPQALARRTFLGRVLAALGGIAVFGRVRPAAAAVAVLPSDYLGEIRLFAGSFAPSGWAFCDGQLLAISTNTALFSILLNRYGGDGTTTFALPDLRGRVAIGQGQGAGLTLRNVGDKTGVETHPLAIAEIPAHTHVARGASAFASAADPGPGMVAARNPALAPQWSATADATMAAGTVANAGSSQPHPNTQPYGVVSFIIALQGPTPTP